MSAGDWRFLKWWSVMWGVSFLAYLWLEQRYQAAALFVVLESLMVSIAWRAQRRSERGEM